MTNLNQGEKQFEGLLSLFLREHQTDKYSSTNQIHLDEDSLSAFVEGVLTQQQATPILKHLVDCFLCRRVTAQLAELSVALSDVNLNSNVIRSNDWLSFWNALTESLLHPYDNVVVAHESDEDDSSEKKLGKDRKTTNK